MDLGVMATDEYSELPRSPELEPHHQMQFSVIPRTPLFGFEFLFNGISTPVGHLMPSNPLFGESFYSFTGVTVSVF